jgi:hypothetical protein
MTSLQKASVSRRTLLLFSQVGGASTARRHVAKKRQQKPVARGSAKQSDRFCRIGFSVLFPYHQEKST